LTILNERLTYFVDDFNYKEPGKFELTTLGGKAALEGAIASLEALISAETVLSNYTFEDGLESACIDHVTDLAGS
jgi:hypothetical protein